MHHAAREWVARWAPDRKVSVVDVGGRDINGTVRDLFDASSYTSVDLVAGSGVDVVADFTTWTPDARVDVVVCCEVAEHCEQWRDIVRKARLILEPDGLFIFTAAGPGRSPHSAVDGGERRPGEWYRNIEPDALDEALTGFARWEIDETGTDIRAVAWRS